VHSVSFLLELEVEQLTAVQAQAVEAKSRARSTWPIRAAQQHRLLDRVRPGMGRPVLRMPDKDDNGNDLLSHQAEWSAPAWAMEPKALPSFAEAIRILGEELSQGFALRATWVGSPVRNEQVLSAEDLARLALDSRLNEFTRYRVPPRDEPTNTSV
jgi:hypothetical protein